MLHPQARALLDRLRIAAEAAGLFDALETGWLLLDCEHSPNDLESLLPQLQGRPAAARREG